MLQEDNNQRPSRPDFVHHCRRCRRRRAIGGFTLIEMMVVVLISMIALTVAVPNFVRARELADQRTCIAQLNQLDAAKRQFALDQKLSDGDTVAMSDIAGWDKYVRGPITGPVCPGGGTYIVGTVGTMPVCTFYGAHTLE